MAGFPWNWIDPGIGREHAADDLDERGFACAVVADQPRDFAGREVHGGVMQGDDGAEALADLFHAKQGVRHFCEIVQLSLS